MGWSVASHLILESEVSLLVITNYAQVVKFEATDRDYFTRREKFASDLGAIDLWSVMDQWPLYIGQVNLARSLAIIELLRSTLHVPGDVAEFGCWHGSTTMLIAKSLRIFDPLSPKRIHVFDSFEGLTEFNDSDIAARGQRGSYRGSREALLCCAELAGVKDDLEIHEGLIENTLPKFSESHRETRFSFVYCDTDLYGATKTILAHAWGLVSRGGLMIFDQWNMAEYPGEGVAVNEFVEAYEAEIEVFKPSFTRQPTLALRRVT